MSDLLLLGLILVAASAEGISSMAEKVWGGTRASSISRS